MNLKIDEEYAFQESELGKDIWNAQKQMRKEYIEKMGIPYRTFKIPCVSRLENEKTGEVMYLRGIRL